MNEKIPSKADALRAMREANYSEKSSDGGVEGHAEALISPSVPTPADFPGSSTRGAGVKSGPSDAKLERSLAVKPSAHNRSDGGSNPPAPTKRKKGLNGTFDRQAYQREYMRKRRQSKLSQQGE